MGPFWKMPATWEQGVTRQGAEELAQAILEETGNRGDFLPKTQKELEESMPRYARMGVFEGFTYTYSGGKLPPAPRRAQTQLGYVVGPGGRANLYADGHAEWKAD
jgi:hypothetical protein